MCVTFEFWINESEKNGTETKRNFLFVAYVTCDDVMSSVTEAMTREFTKRFIPNHLSLSKSDKIQQA